MTEASFLAVLFGELQCSSVMSGCNRDLDKYGGIILWFLLMIYMFKALGAICDEYFVPALEVIVEKLQVSNDVAGATFMAAGSSAPELFTSLVATFLIVNAGGVGTIVGSAIFNILVMNGVTAFVACKDQPLQIWWYPLIRDSSFYLLSITELVVFLADEEVETWESLLMVLTYFFYCLYMKFNPKVIAALGLTNPEDAKEYPSEEDGAEVMPTPVYQDEAGPGGTGDPPRVSSPDVDPVKQQSAGSGSGYESSGKGSDPGRSSKKKWSYHSGCQNGEKNGSQSLQQIVPVEEDGTAVKTAAPPDDSSEPRISGAEQGSKSWLRDPLLVLWEKTMPDPELTNGFPLFVLSILWIGICTYLMVDSTNRIGIILTFPPFVIGLIFLAAGTSIPDTLGSIAVAKQGEGDMAIANALGSNVFDILIGLGVPWTISNMIGKKVTFPNQFDDFIGDIVILVVALVMFVVCLLVNKWSLNRTIGGVLIALYFIFVLYQLLAVFAFGWKSADDRRLLYDAGIAGSRWIGLR